MAQAMASHDHRQSSTLNIEIVIPCLAYCIGEVEVDVLVVTLHRKLQRSLNFELSSINSKEILSSAVWLCIIKSSEKLFLHITMYPFSFRC